MRRQLSGVVKYCWPDCCWPANHVPEAELRAQPSVALPRHAAGNQRLRIDRAPVREFRRDIGIGYLFDIGGRIDRREQAGAAQVVGDDAGDVARHLGIRSGAAGEIRQGDRHRLNIALGDVEFQHRLSGTNTGGGDQSGARSDRQQATTRERRVKKRKRCFQHR